MADRKYVKVPIVMQLETLECGAACLSMILAYHGKWLPLERVRMDCGVSRDGSNAKNIVKAAQNYGLKAKAYKFEPEDLKKKNSFPCIIHWNFNHFVVLCGFKGSNAVINDPARGKVIVSESELDEAFTGVCLCFEPDADFEKGGKPRSVFSYAVRKMSKSKASALLIIISSAIISILGIINLAMSRTFIDTFLAGNNKTLLMPFVIFLAVLGFLQIIVLGIKEVSLHRIDGRFAAIGTCEFMWKILHMPIGFFSQRTSGDIQLRMKSNAEIAKNIVITIAPLALDALMMVLYLAIMLKYSVILTLVGIISVFLNLLLCGYVSEKRTNIMRVMLRDKSRLATSTVSGIEMIETIRVTGGENGFFERWSGDQAKVNTEENNYVRIDYKIGILPELIYSLTEIIVFITGILFVIKGDFTPGLLLAFQGFLSAFMKPSKKILLAVSLLQELRCDIERVEDVMEYKQDGIYKDEVKTDKYNKLSGNIELKNVTYGHSNLEKPFINDFSMTVKPGQKIAIVGMSGCGKSTIAKLISGLFEPWEGEILFDGQKISEIDRAIFTGSVAVVDQDIILFEDTIANNIKLWDESIEDFEMIMAARDAQIHNDIMNRLGGYNYRICEDAKDFSGGQKQCMEIARVLAQDPTIIILDEATSALDAKTEHDVVKAISDRGVTCVVIAHRLSTIRDCDMIIVMENGCIKEQGTHDELYAKGGLYSALISNE